MLGMGAPLIANYQSALFYPPYWLYFLTYVLGGIGWMAWTQSLIVVAHLILAGLGMAALSRRLGMGRLAQTISGLAFSMSGYLVARAWFASINAAVAWLPWVMLLAYDLTRERDRRTVLKLGLVMGMQLLAGHAQTSWYTLLLAGLWVAFWGGQYALNQNLKSRFLGAFQSVVRLGWAILWGVGIAAVQLFPTAVYLLQSQRAGAVDMQFALNYSFWPWRFLDLLAPGLFGSPVTGDYWGYGNFWEDAVYVGMLPILLVIGVLLNLLIKSIRRSDIKRSRTLNPAIELRAGYLRSTLVFTLFGIILISFIFALGKNTPVYPWLYEHIPTFDMFQAPTRISIWAVFSLALLAGMGAENWRKPEGRALYWTRLGTAGAFAVSLGAGLAFLGMGDVGPTFIRATALAGLWALGAGVLTLTKPEKESTTGASRWWSWAVVAWVAADVLVAGWGLNPAIDLEFYTQRNAAVDVIEKSIGEGRLYLSSDHEDTLKYERFLRFDHFDPGENWDDLRAVSLPNLNILDGIPSANNFDPFVPERFAKWMGSLELVDGSKAESLFDLMGVTVVERLDEARGLGVRFDPRANANRLRWVPCAVNAKDAQDAWQQVFLGEIDFENIVILEGVEPTQRSHCKPAQGQVHLEDEHSNMLLIKVETDSAGWVVLSDVWYLGWRAFVDDDSAQIHQANYLFRAVEVPQGIHQVRIEYQPLEFYVGLVISVMAACAMLFLRRNAKISHILKVQ